jgi:polar amino acid transport system substrate-binding protein
MRMPFPKKAVLPRLIAAWAGAVLLHGAASAATAQPAVPAHAAPALFTTAQAASGAGKYADNCEQCHGTHLEGRAGPALTGPNFASAKASLKVSDIFTFILQNMPATQPGSLPKQDYVEIMAFLLQQNGYQPGTAKLTASIASTSKVPLLYQGK